MRSGVTGRRLRRSTDLIGLTPDLTIILDLPVAEGIARIGRRGDAPDRYERMGADFFVRVGEGFRMIAAAEPERCAIVPAGESEVAVADRVAALVAERLG